ncbi:MAG TPA: BON domain-containing protein [Dissulfurispiraceae bacterium]|nr:BON domain-containing protein [Dissulfurispiraceae bacterium]
MKKVIMLAICMIFGLVLLSGCATTTGKTAGENIDDAAIHARVSKIIVQDPEAHFLKIDVSVTKGDVVLTGIVKNKETETRLVDKIKGVSGVTSVKSLLTITGNK